MKSLRRPNRWLWLVLAFQLGLGLATIVVTPAWQGHEQDYYTVVRFLLNNGRMPTEADYPPGEAQARQATQPPLYFLVAAPIVAVLDDAQTIPPGRQPGVVCIGAESTNSTLIDYPITPAYLFPVSGAVLASYVLRILNLLFGILAVTLTYLAGRVFFPKRPAISLVGAALLAFEPNTLQMVTTISNEALLVAISVANLYCIAQMLASGKVSWRWALPAVVFAVLAMLTRLSGWAVLGFDVVAFGFAVLRTLREARKRVKRNQLHAALVGLMLLVVASTGIAVFNYSQYGSVFGRYHWLDDLVLHEIHNFDLSAATVIGVFDQTRISYEGPMSLLVPRRAILTLYTLVVVIGLGGSLAGLGAVVVQRLKRETAAELGSYLLLIEAGGIAVLLVLFRNILQVTWEGGVTLYNTATIFAPLRYYDAGIPALALLLSAGWMVWGEFFFSTIVRVRPVLPLARLAQMNPFGIGMALLWMAVTLLGVVTVVHNRPTVEVNPSSDIGDTRFESLRGAQEEGGPQVVNLAATLRSQDGMIDLTMHVVGRDPMLLNYVAEVDTIANGAVVNRCEFLPARGYYPTTLWQAGAHVTMKSSIPNCSGAIDGPIDLRLRWLGADMNGTIQRETEPVRLTIIDAPLAQAATCPQTLAILAGGYRLTRFNAPPSVRIGELYMPSTNWIVTEPSKEATGRAYLFVHNETGESYVCDFTDRSVSSWTRGEYIYFDRCPMTFPPVSTPGEYSVSMVMVNAAGERMSAVDEGGHPLPRNEVPLGIVTVEP